MAMFPSRRILLSAAAAFGGLGLGRGLTNPMASAQELRPTPQCPGDAAPTPRETEGPFFKPRSPERSDLVESGTAGPVLSLEGRVLTRSCAPVERALIDLWHADEHGEYDNSGFHYRGHIFAGADGRYRFRTILPGLYTGRTRHFHVKVQAPARPVLTTQLYFPDEARNATDSGYMRELEVQMSGEAEILAARFDLVLDMA
jgi:protocatechuate 3,4-dioxygenase beta subunit